MNMFKPTGAKTIREYIQKIDEPRRGEIKKLHDFIKKTVPEFKPYMERSLIGYGKRHYKYASGREGDWPVVALASQKQYISVYICETDGKQYLAEKYKKELKASSSGKSCIRYKKFEDIDFKALKKVLRESVKLSRK